MKAVRFHEFGGSDVLRVEELDDPKPGPGEVTIRIRASALNHLDVDVREGISRFPIEPPHTLGIEVAGEVAEVGPGVDGWQPGDRVNPYIMATCGECRYCRTGRESLCLTPGFIGFSTGGGYAEKLACSTRHLVADPRRGVLRGRGRAPGRLRHGPPHALQRARGSRRARPCSSTRSGAASARPPCSSRSWPGPFVIGNASSDEKLEREGVRARRRPEPPTEDVAARVMKVTDDRGVDVVYEHVGGELFQRASTPSPRTAGSSSAAATPGGRALRHHPLLPPPALGDRLLRLQKHEVERCFELLARGRIKPLVHATFPLEEAKEAMEMMERREHFGKILLVPDQHKGATVA